MRYAQAMEKKTLSRLEKLVTLSKIRLFFPPHIKIVLDDLLSWSYRIVDNVIHIKEAVRWIAYAQDVTNDGGVSAQYSLIRGWRASAPETTGYIIPTIFNYYHFTSDRNYKKRAIRMCDFLVDIQLPNGSFQGGTLDDPPKPIVFCTGQCLLGLARGYKENKSKRYLNAAIKAANWLIEVQEKSGAWQKYTYHNIAHAYHTRVAWALLELFEITMEKQYEKAAVNNLEWGLSKQRTNGWFDDCAFALQADPFTHTIAYTVRGFLETGLLLDNEKYIQVAKKTSDALFKIFTRHNFIVATYKEDWTSKDKYSCLTGCAQMAIIWFKLFELLCEDSYLETALKVNRFLKSLQNISTIYCPVRGGIKGSHPIYGKYLPFSYPNWATKFFVDSLMLEQSIQK